MADPTSTVIAVMDTVDAIQSHPPIQDPVDVIQRVRQVYQDQDVPLSETALQQAVVQHTTPLRADAPPPARAESAPRPSSKGGLGFLECLLVSSMLGMFLIVGYALYSTGSVRATLSEVSPALLLAAHQDVHGAQQALATTTADALLKELGATWSVDSETGHTVVTVKHAPVALVGTLSDDIKTDAASSSPLELRANGILVQDRQALKVLDPCRGRYCPKVYVDVTLKNSVAR